MLRTFYFDRATPSSDQAIQTLTEGVMKLKKQPSRDDLAVALITQRGLAQIVKLQNEQIRRLKRAMGRLLFYPRLKLRVN
jgi:hypothetical protein